MPTPLVPRLKRLRYLNLASDSLLERMASSGILRRYKASEFIYVQGDEPKAAYLIVSGIVNRETTQRGDTVIQQSRAFAGDWLGLGNATSRITPYMHSAIATDSSDVLVFSLSLLTALRSAAEFTHYLLQIAGRDQLLQEEHQLNNLCSARSYDKLILFLAAEMGRMQKRGVPIMNSPYIVGTQKYFADTIGATRETVSRDLQPLLTEGIIERTQGVRPIGYNVLKPEVLSELASSPMRRNAFYANTRPSRTHRRFNDMVRDLGTAATHRAHGRL